MNKILFRLGLLGIFLLSFSLRFWGLDRFNTLVFDEVYFAVFGNNYLIDKPFFNAHPPLSQYLIGMGIWISSHLPIKHDAVNSLTGSLLSPWDYRWMNAFTGSFIPLVISLLTYQLSYRRGFALLAGFFTACDGLFLVESRYALSNIYIVIFGLLGHWLLLLALEKPQRKRWLWLIVSGIFFGACVATKWNGLWFLIGAYSLWIVVWIIKVLQSEKFQPNHLPILPFLRLLNNPNDVEKSRHSQLKIPLVNLGEINIFEMISYLGIIPGIVYSLLWIPHLQLDKRYDFIEVHKQILGFHLRLGGDNIHPYCAAWYKWPLLTRPMAYYYETSQSINDPLPVFGPALPSGYAKIVYDVHAMGNPFLWWFALAAIIFLLGFVMAKLAVPMVEKNRLFVPRNLTVDVWIGLYLVINYLTNLLPWVKVTRCVFIYHYMTAIIFSFIAIAWIVDRTINSYYPIVRAFGVTITFVIIAAFIFWIPIYLGLPLSMDAYQARMWFRSWI